MEGYEVVTIEDVIGDRRHLHHDDGQQGHHHLDHMKKMKDKAIVGNIGHFDNEIQMEKLEKR
jgi:adenosylhomocysteinase